MIQTCNLMLLCPHWYEYHHSLPVYHATDEVKCTSNRLWCYYSIYNVLRCVDKSVYSSSCS